MREKLHVSSSNKRKDVFFFFSKTIANISYFVCRENNKESELWHFSLNVPRLIGFCSVINSSPNVTRSLFLKVHRNAPQFAFFPPTPHPHRFVNINQNREFISFNVIRCRQLRNGNRTGESKYDIAGML